MQKFWGGVLAPVLYSNIVILKIPKRLDAQLVWQLLQGNKALSGSCLALSHFSPAWRQEDIPWD